ncbi:MAG: FAD/NAD(P)-binding protein [Rhizobiaceae bacterium]|nr:FAD/NAD(P)-binding protein [Rhizobiaceae bacterium]
MSGRRSFVIVGGGASGVLLAAQLLKSDDPALRVTVVERSDGFGHGLAYSSTLDEHLLNVGARGMSAFPDEPDHFWRWLRKHGLADDSETPFFAPRRLYGDYLRKIIVGMAEREPVRLRLLHGLATSLSPTASGVEVQLANGTSLIAHAAILAAGHDTEPASEFSFAVKPGSNADAPLPPDAPVLILGTGLSMVDAWLALRHRGHRGPVIALSRRGLLPAPHRAGKPLRLDSADVPLGTDLSYFVDWFRDLVRAHQKAGGDWRDVVDGIRPFNQRIWQSWPAGARRRFLEHTKAWWDIHRHRMAPQIHSRLSAALESGELKLLAGRLHEARQTPDGFVAQVQLRHQPTIERITVARIYDCTGIVKDVASGSIAIVRSLTERGLARVDPLRIGLDVTVNCAVVDAAGAASDKIYAIGPLTRGTFFEIDAVPDIRVQAAHLAARLTGTAT